MKKFNEMQMGEIEAEITASRERDKILEIEFDKLISHIQDVKDKICHTQTSLPLPITRMIHRKKSMPQRIVDLIKENDGKFTSNEVYNYFVQDKTYSDVETAKKIIPPLLSRLKSEEYINNNAGEPWKWLKDYD